MKQALDKLSWRVVAAILVVFSLVGLTLIVLSFNSQRESDVSERTGNNTESIPDRSNSGNPSLPRQKFVDTRFNFTYPSIAAVTEENIEGTGRVVHVDPTDGSEWNIEIQESESAQVDFNAILAAYQAYGLEDELSTVAGLTVNKFSGFVIPPPDGIYQISVAFRSGSYIYQISEYYSGNAKSSQYEGELENIISSFKINNQ